MKKIIPIVILAAAAVFLLAGCDAMLESIYPDQTGRDKGTNSVSVDVAVDPSAITDWYAHKVWIRLENMDTSVTWYRDSMVMGSSTSYRCYAGATFDFLSDGTYAVTAWFDSNDNGYLDFDEYARTPPAVYMSGSSSPASILISLP